MEDKWENVFCVLRNRFESEWSFGYLRNPDSGIIYERIVRSHFIVQNNAFTYKKINIVYLVMRFTYTGRILTFLTKLKMF